MPFTDTDPVLFDLLPLDGLQNSVATLTAALKLRAQLARTHITGLQLSWNSASATSIIVSTGLAYIPGSGLLAVESPITKSGLSLSASTWYHVYLYNSGSVTSPVAAAEVVTTAPTNYFGTAYQKTGDASRRYLGSVRTDGAGNLYNFVHNPVTGLVLYRANIATAPFRVLSNGAATTATSVDCSAVVPLTSAQALIRMNNSASASNIFLGSSDGFVPTSSSGSLDLAASRDAGHQVALNSSRQFQYIYDSSPSPSGLFCDLYGYYFVR